MNMILISADIQRHMIEEHLCGLSHILSLNHDTINKQTKKQITPETRVHVASVEATRTLTEYVSQGDVIRQAESAAAALKLTVPATERDRRPGHWWYRTYATRPMVDDRRHDTVQRWRQDLISLTHRMPLAACIRAALLMQKPAPPVANRTG